jgi:hypothetical protein
MAQERDRAITYYLDTSVYNQLVHQPGYPKYIDRLKRARDEGTAYTFVSRYLLQELAVTSHGNRDIGHRLMKVVQDIALRGRLVKDTPVLTHEDVHRLVDPSVDKDFLEPLGCENARKVSYLIDEFAQDRPLDGQWKHFCELQREKQRKYRSEWKALWKAVRTEDRAKFGGDKIPRTFKQFMGKKKRRAEALLGMVRLWTPKSLRNVLPLEELARRIEETTSYRGMLYYITSAYFWKILKNDKLDKGDAFDAHHGLIAANFDVFVCKDVKARKYAGAWCRNGQRVLTLREFIRELG